MESVAKVLRTVTNKSLVLIDELGRGTDACEGLALSWAICESLLRKSCAVFLASHLLGLTKLTTLYPQVKNCHLECAMQKDTVKPYYTVAAGVSGASVRHALSCVGEANFPPEVLKDAWSIVTLIAGVDSLIVAPPADSGEGGASMSRMKDSTAEQAGKVLCNLLTASSADSNALSRILEPLKKKLSNSH
eukprot:Lankesteria_metandrocarpae@DN5184_c0_g1_i14.p3